jgi:hypothetical protein
MGGVLRRDLLFSAGSPCAPLDIERPVQGRGHHLTRRAAHDDVSYSCIARLLADSLIAAVERETNDPRPSEVAEMRAADDKWVAFSFQDATSVLEKTLRVAAKQNKTRIQTGNGIAESVRHPKSVMRRLVHLMKCLSV